MLRDEELLELLGLRLDMEIVSHNLKKRVEGCLAPVEDKPETYVFYCHGGETKSMLSHETVIGYHPIYSKKRHMFVNRTLKRFSEIVEHAEEKGLYDLSDFDKLNKLPAKVSYPFRSKGIWRPRIDLSRGSPIWNVNGQLRFNNVGCWLTTYASLCYKSHNEGAEALNNVGIGTTTSILG